MRGSRRILWRWTWLLLLSLLVAACGSRAPAEDQIRRAINAGATAAEAGDAVAFGNVISEDFSGNTGELDRRRLLAMLRVMRLRGEHLTAMLGPVSLESRADRYVASFTVTLGSGGKRWLPEQLGVYQVTAAWRNEHGHWRCYNAEWKRRL